MLGFFVLFGAFFGNTFIAYRKCLPYNLAPRGDKIPAPALPFNMPVRPLFQLRDFESIGQCSDTWQRSRHVRYVKSL